LKVTNVRWHEGKIGKKQRESLLNQKAVLIWFTGLSGSGKSTLARELEKRLFERKNLCFVLDGDNIRHGLNGDLGFSADDRKENIRRIGEVCKLFVNAGLITISAFISPFRTDRNNIRQDLKLGKFIEIYVKCPLEICEQRDVKGLYAKVRLGEIDDFTGISSPYEEPLNPEIIINTSEESIKTSVEKIMNYLFKYKIIEE